MATFEKLNIADEKKEMIEMPRHSFIQMTKLHNVMGRIDYITSTVKQENLYAVYATQPLRSFWKDLAKCNREEFAKSGTTGKCIEARKLIIALPEGLYHYEHDYLIKHFATDFKKKYGVDCYAALHHNKRKTNFHIHLIFAERTKLEKPVVKVASRNMFYDENGKHVRTKKEILDESGNIRNGCKIIRKGEVYEKKEFSVKDDRFKRDSFLDEAKVFFTNEINQLVLYEEDKLKVFDKNSPYLATKKIGKNNPMEEQIKTDNEVRQEWNRTVDRAIVKVIIGVVVILLAIGGATVFGVNQYQKKKAAEEYAQRVEEYSDNLKLAAVTMLTGASDAESSANLIKQVWYNAIYEKRDDKTDKYTRPKGYFVSDFNDALGNLYADSDFSSKINSIEDNQDTVNGLMKKLKNPPDEYKDAYDAVSDLYDAYISLTNCATDPSGSLQTYSSTFNDADTNTLNAYKAMKLYLDE